MEHRGERYRIVRRGHVVAQLAPVTVPAGAVVKDVLRRHSVDPSWGRETAELRRSLVTEDRF